MGEDGSHNGATLLPDAVKHHAGKKHTDHPDQPPGPGTLPDTHFAPSCFRQEEQRSEPHDGKYNGDPLRLPGFIGAEDQEEPGYPEKQNQEDSQNPLIGE